MNAQSRLRKLIVVGSLVAASSGGAALLGMSSASASTAGLIATTTTTKPATTTTVKTGTAGSTTTTAAKTVAKKVTAHYEVVDGIFTTRAAARARIKTLTAAKFTKFTIKVTGTKFAVVHAGLTKTTATALVKAIATAKIGQPRIKRLA